jgi:hypothetical protein
MWFRPPTGSQDTHPEQFHELHTKLGEEQERLQRLRHVLADGPALASAWRCRDGLTTTSMWTGLLWLIQGQIGGWNVPMT